MKKELFALILAGKRRFIPLILTILLIFHWNRVFVYIRTKVVST